MKDGLFEGASLRLFTMVNKSSCECGSYSNGDEVKVKLAPHAGFFCGFFALFLIEPGVWRKHL
jgi:hypothetical protein